MSVLHGELVEMFPGRKLKKIYLVSESILHLEDSILDGRKNKKTYLVSDLHLHSEDLMLIGRKNKKTYLVSESILHLEDSILDGRRKMLTLESVVGSVVLDLLLVLLVHAHLVK